MKLRCRQVTSDGQRPGLHAAKAVEGEHITDAWTKGNLGRDNPQALVTTVQLVIQSNMGVRAVTECHSILNQDIIEGPKDKTNPLLPVWMELAERLTKTRHGQKDCRRELEGRVYLDNEMPDICPVRTLLYYKHRKTPKQLGDDFPYFLGVKNSARKNPDGEEHWYTDLRMGRNTLAKNLKTAMERSGVDTKACKISSTSARKSMMQAGADAQVPGHTLSMLAGQSSISSKLSYLAQKQASHQAASMVINRKVSGKKTAENFSTVFDKITGQQNKTASSGEVGEEERKRKKKALNDRKQQTSCSSPDTEEDESRSSKNDPGNKERKKRKNLKKSKNKRDQQTPSSSSLDSEEDRSRSKKRKQRSDSEDEVDGYTISQSRLEQFTRDGKPKKREVHVTVKNAQSSMDKQPNFQHTPQASYFQYYPLQSPQFYPPQAPHYFPPPPPPQYYPSPHYYPPPPPRYYQPQAPYINPVPPVQYYPLSPQFPVQQQPHQYHYQHSPPSPHMHQQLSAPTPIPNSHNEHLSSFQEKSEVTNKAVEKVEETKPVDVTKETCSTKDKGEAFTKEQEEASTKDREEAPTKEKEEALTKEREEASTREKETSSKEKKKASTKEKEASTMEKTEGLIIKAKKFSSSENKENEKKGDFKQTGNIVYQIAKSTPAWPVRIDVLESKNR